jgi:hypothetical protein
VVRHSVIHVVKIGVSTVNQTALCGWRFTITYRLPQVGRAGVMGKRYRTSAPRLPMPRSPHSVALSSLLLTENSLLCVVPGFSVNAAPPLARLRFYLVVAQLQFSGPMEV